MYPTNEWQSGSTISPKIGVGVIVQKEDKILLGQRRGADGEGTWGTPGGHLDQGETLEACARRELLEEVGLHAESLRLGPWIDELVSPQKRHYITLFVFVKQFTGEPCLLEPHKCTSWQWFSWEKLPSPLFVTLDSIITYWGIDGLRKLAQMQ